MPRTRRARWVKAHDLVKHMRLQLVTGPAKLGLGGTDRGCCPRVGGVRFQRCSCRRAPCYSRSRLETRTVSPANAIRVRQLGRRASCPVRGVSDCELCPASCPPLLQTYLPLDMRSKKTRAIRRRLTKEQVIAREPACVHLPACLLVAALGNQQQPSLRAACREARSLHRHQGGTHRQQREQSEAAGLAIAASAWPPPHRPGSSSGGA